MHFSANRDILKRKKGVANINRLGLYLHLPFCNGKCPYCDFYSVNRLDLRDRYTDRLIDEMREYARPDRIADTLYLGGGTPPLLGVDNLLRLIEAAREYYRFTGEATLEANPNSVDPDSLRRLRQGGFNRISFGMQSANPEELAVLGRTHAALQVETAVSWAQAAGFDNISLDLMLGIPKQTPASALASAEFAVGLGVSHLSAYLLKVEENTPFFQNGIESCCPDEETVCSIYLSTVAQLEKWGYSQYEISNFAKQGNACQHNLKYWRCEEYLGFGTAAHGYLDGVRYGHTRDLEGYLQNPADTRYITDNTAGGAEEALMLRMRLTEGIDRHQLAQLGIDPETFIQGAIPYLRAGLMANCNGNLRLTPQGFLVSNQLIGNLLYRNQTEL